MTSFSCYLMHLMGATCPSPDCYQVQGQVVKALPDLIQPVLPSICPYLNIQQSSPMRCCHLSPTITSIFMLLQTYLLIYLFIHLIISIFDLFSYKNYNLDQIYNYMCIMSIVDINVFMAFILVAFFAFAQRQDTHCPSKPEFCKIFQLWDILVQKIYLQPH